MATIYWLDANVFIQAKNGPYAFNMVPQFWSFLSENFENGTFACPKTVYDELIDGGDELSEWCKCRREKGFCHRPTEEVQACLGLISGHVMENYASHQATEFLWGADAWLIAHAMVGDGVVVTHEVAATHKSRVKIPTICKFFRVQYMNTYGMLKALKADFSPK
jgi:Domain of unknown function (DUF4411)